MVALLPSLNEAQRRMETATRYIALAAEIQPECEDDDKLAESDRCWRMLNRRAADLEMASAALPSGA
jgi:hypothetical protein